MGGPSRQLLLRHGDSYAAGGFANSHFEYYLQHKHPSLILPDPLMADDPTTSSNQPQNELQEAALENTAGGAAAAGASQEAQRGFQAGWLQLGVGSAPASEIIRSRGAMELQLFPERPPTLPFPADPAAASTSYGSDLRVVTQPQRLRSGVWLALRPAENQVNEPFLPQLPKSFLRIKNERMTIRLLMRYLANKLGLHDESEVEITCRRQQLLPYATLEDVRDQIWCTGASEAPGPTSPAVDHVMKLYYSRRA